MNIVVKTPRAAEISGIKHGRLNWLISHGLFPWVPDAWSNTPRNWDADDLVILSLYQELVNARHPVRQAVTIANTVGRAARMNPNCTMVGFVHDSKGPRAVAFSNLGELIDWEYQKDFKTMAIFAIAPRRQAIEKAMAA
jgi:hypothetical protein